MSLAALAFEQRKATRLRVPEPDYWGYAVFCGGFQWWEQWVNTGRAS